MQTLSGTFEDGIILTYIDRMKILIPKRNLIDNGFVFVNNTYNDWVIGDVIHIVVDKNQIY